MKKHVLNLSLVTSLVLSPLHPSLLLSHAHASSVNVQTHVAPGNSRYMMNESATTEGEGRYFFGLDYNYLNEPLVELNPTRERRLSTLVDTIQTLDLTAGLDVAGHFSLNATVPVNLVQKYQSAQSFALGDARLFSKIYLVKEGRAFNLSVIPELRLPTGDQALFLSDGSLGFGGMLAAERDFGSFSAVANVGYRQNSGARYREMDYRRRVPMSLGVSVPVTPKWAINGEVAGERILPVNSYQNPGEIYGGARYQLNKDAVLTGGASVGSTNQVSSADYRFLVGLKITAAPAERQLAAQAASELKTSQASPVRVTADQIVIDQEIRFAHDSDRLLPTTKPILDQVAQAILVHQVALKSVEIQGHCNELGSDEYNLALSRRRAAAVRAYLEKQGVQASLLTPVGYGKRQPKAKVDEFARRVRLEINRRVEFKVDI
jgi:outer membrane protein OmpA-like peptidoglycan-associated protein